MDEQTAKTKWCPMARVLIVPNGEKISVVSNRDICFMVPTNSFDPATDITKCIASDCALWVWEKKPECRFAAFHDDPKAKDEPAPPRPVGVPESWIWEPGDEDFRAGWWEPDEEADKRRQGHCGLVTP